MGLAPEVTLVVKHTFLEYVEATGRKGTRCRAFTDTALLGDADHDSTCSEPSASSTADVTGPSSSELEEESPRWPSTPMLTAQDKTPGWWEPMDGESGVTAADMAALSQPMAWWWWPADWASPLDCGEGCVEAFGGLPMAQEDPASVAAPCAPSGTTPTGCLGEEHTSGDSTEDSRTTVMIRSLPENCSRDVLQEVLDSKGFSGQYDFLYAPVDFGTGCGLGYAFVNLVSPDAAARVWADFDGLQEWPVPTQSASTVCWSHPHQGLPSHVERYMNSPVMHHSVPDAWKPAMFMSAMRVAFPPPTKVLKAPKAPRSRRTAEAA